MSFTRERTTTDMIHDIEVIEKARPRHIEPINRYKIQITRVEVWADEWAAAVRLMRDIKSNFIEHGVI